MQVENFIRMMAFNGYWDFFLALRIIEETNKLRYEYLQDD